MLKKIGILASHAYCIPYLNWIAKQDGKLFEVVGYLDNSDDCFVKEVATYATKRNIFTLEQLAVKSDLLLSLGYWKIISQNIIEQVPMGILNLHHSYRLKYKGRHSCSWAIIFGEKEHGSTLHYITSRLDDGPILATQSIPISETDTAFTLFSKVNAIGLGLVKEYLPIALDSNMLRQYSLSLPDPDSKSFKAKDLQHELPVSLMQDPELLMRYIRALTYPGYPKPYFQIDQQRVFLSLENENEPS